MESLSWVVAFLPDNVLYKVSQIRPSLKYLRPSEHIPSKIEVDVSKLDIEDRIFMRDIEIHPSLKLLSKN
ncbi:hypothetical protein RIF29_16162 [Crotalaria pallida]|uniref:Large ribosomal subunit protein bL25 beta domain-containing protein n=1 Tax=Crotalaria pallida TaxID=3830 RepID=A0AAN9FKH2_CROPI